MDSTSLRGQLTSSRLQYWPPDGPKTSAQKAAVLSMETVSKTLVMLPFVASRICFATPGTCWRASMHQIVLLSGEGLVNPTYIVVDCICAELLHPVKVLWRACRRHFPPRSATQHVSHQNRPFRAMRMKLTISRIEWQGSPWPCCLRI